MTEESEFQIVQGILVYDDLEGKLRTADVRIQINKKTGDVV